ncbi:ABC transporter permease [Edwardsiella hoshinae]|uniref:ABC transporter permease n=1 Tax=Edwardsiella hoshinae TaxID=93378 RepID=A0A376DAN1_9GAMM|nr:phospholipid-binding lipoprotein MlaA [Edwardsiella hoshinae]AOV96361.1 ABC transporter permease [Edwardsiella hoshinae]QPR27758.1 phospholipid-binding lipoprotein MlaA [Edwardsiella hoshinae]STC86090.1 Probable phospholipid-binding lipoprotein mlaA precursor [Edwardsiella hoshinae]
MKYRLAGVALASVMLAGCATSASQPDSQGRSDPLEGFNRAMFSVNYDYLDPYVVRPIAVVWRDYLPRPARNGLMNFFVNLSEPASMVNCFAEGRIYDGFRHFNRFFLNTTLGLGGLIDVAAMANPAKLGKQDPQRFGSTLGYYHVPYGPYLVLPGYGSFTLRQEGGDSVDYLYPPLGWLTFWMSAGKWALEGIETRAQLLDSDGLLRNSPDPYITVREAYFQYNDFLANGGQVKPEVNPNAQAIQDDLKDIDAAN